jgi:hypothetical protein
MYGFFTKDKKEPAKNTAHEKIANSIVARSLELKEKGAVFMQRKTEQLSARSKKIIIVFFCMVTGGISLYTIGVSLSPSQKRSFEITKMKASKNLTRTGDENINTVMNITKHELDNIQTFEAYMDSLNTSDAGRKIADSILLNRPGLIDSIFKLKQIYLQQSSKK